MTEDLDSRIRTMVRAAVASAPTPPVIDDLDLDTDNDQGRAAVVSITEAGAGRGRRSRWAATGVALIGVAAAATVLVIRLNAPDALAPADSTSATSEATPSASSEPTPSSTAPLPPQDSTDSLLVAGESGVTVTDAGGAARVITTESMSAAVLLADDRVVMQRGVGTDELGVAADSALLGDDGNGSVAPLTVPAALQQALHLHDAALLGGRQFILLDARAGEICAGGGNCPVVLYLWAIDSAVLIEVARIDGWEGGWGAMSLSTTGRVVGTTYDSATTSPFMWSIDPAIAAASTSDGPSVNGQVAAPTELAALGLQPAYGDCSDCPDSFATNSAGDLVTWVTTTADGPTVLTVVGFDGIGATVPISAVPAGSRFSAVDVSGVRLVNGEATGTAALRTVDFESAAGRQWYMLDLGSDTATLVNGGSGVDRVAFG